MSESVLGDCLRAAGVPRDRFVVATKCGRYREGFDFSAARVTRSVDESLDRLGLDYIDILHCHDIEFTDLDQVPARPPPVRRIAPNSQLRPTALAQASVTLLLLDVPSDCE